MIDNGDAGEQKINPVEQDAKASDKELDANVSKVKDDASKDKPQTFTEKDVTQKVSDAMTAFMKSPDFEKVVQSAKDKSINQEMQPLRDKIKGLEEGKSEKDLVELEARESRLWEEEGIPKDAIKNYQNERRGQVKAAEELLDSIDKHKTEIWETKAYKIAKTAKVDMDELLKCKTVEEMEQKALELSHVKYSSEVGELKQRIKELEGEGKGGDNKGEDNKIDSGKEGISGSRRSFAERYPTME